MRACLRGVVGGQRAEGGGRWAEGFTSCPLRPNRTDPVSFLSSLCQQLPWRFVIAIWNFIDVSRK